MDAAQKLLKNIAILTAAALLLSTVGLAQPTLVATPSTVVPNPATGNNTAEVDSSDGATVITYSIGIPSYNGGDPPWLNVTGGTATPAMLSFQARSVAFVSASPHTATVVLHPSNGAADLTITVSYDTGGGGGGGRSSLTASNTNVSLDSIHTSATVNIGTTGAVAVAATVSWTIQSGSTNWLSATLNPFIVDPSAGSILRSEEHTSELQSL